MLRIPHLRRNHAAPRCARGAQSRGPASSVMRGAIRSLQRPPSLRDRHTTQDENVEEAEAPVATAAQTCDAAALPSPVAFARLGARLRVCRSSHPPCIRCVFTRSASHEQHHRRKSTCRNPRVRSPIRVSDVGTDRHTRIRPGVKPDRTWRVRAPAVAVIVGALATAQGATATTSAEDTPVTFRHSASSRAPNGLLTAR
jgi:hypothetical protein